MMLGLKDRAKNEPSVVIEEARQVEELMEHPGWKVLEAAIETREKRELRAVMARSVSESASEYADFIGFLKGLRALEPSARAFAAFGKKLEQEQKDIESRGEAA